MSFSGLYIPATTPFDPVTGEIAPVHFRNNLRRWLEEPIDGYVLFGSTGEGILVDDDEKTKLIEYARELIPAGLKLVVGITADSTRAIARKAKRFAELGADAFLIAPPPYAGDAPPNETYDAVIAWTLGSRLVERDIGATRDLAREIRGIDPQEDRPLLAGADAGLEPYSRLADLLLLERQTLGTSVELSTSKIAMRSSAS